MTLPQVTRLPAASPSPCATSSKEGVLASLRPGHKEACWKMLGKLQTRLIYQGALLLLGEEVSLR